MDLDTIIALIAFAAPGGLAVQGWDWGCHRTNRPFHGTVGYGILVSLFGYATFQVVGFVDLGTLLDDHGALSLRAMLASTNLLFFLLLNLLAGGMGVLAGRWVQPKLARLTGKSFFQSVWGQMMDAATAADRKHGTWLLLRTKSGWEWFGRPTLIPPEPRSGDFLALGQPSCRDSGTGEWRPQDLPVVLVPFDDIEYIQLSKGLIGDSNARPIHEEAQPPADTASLAADGATGQPTGRHDPYSACPATNPSASSPAEGEVTPPPKN